MNENIMISLSRLTDKEIKYPLIATIKEVKGGGLKLRNQSLVCFIGIADETLLVSVVETTNYKKEKFNAKMPFDKIGKINELKSMMSTQKMFDVTGTDGGYFKFSVSVTKNEADSVSNLIKELLTINTK